MRGLPWGLLFLVLGASAPGCVEARVIALYAAGDTVAVEATRNAAKALRQNPAASVAKNIATLSSDATVLDATFSVKPGQAAYIWSDTPLLITDFAMNGTSLVFESGVPAVAPSYAQDDAQEEAPPDPLAKGSSRPVILWSTELREASLGSRGLHVRYSLAEAGPVTLRAWSLDGRAAGVWNWEEEAGTHAHTLVLREPQRALLVRWEHGETRVRRRVTAE